MKLAFSGSCSWNESFNEEINTTYKYTVSSKMLLKFSKKNLELTDKFKNEVEKDRKSVV